jgi:hypothetical protein
MLTSILTSTPALALYGALALSLIALLGNQAIKALAAHPKLAPLEPLVVDAEKALTDAEKTALADVTAGKTPAQAALDAGKTALADAKADIGDAERALSGEVSVLVNGVPNSATTPGGATVNLPSTAKRGVVPLIVVGLIALGIAIAGGIAALVATGNSGQVLSCVESAVNGNPAAVGTLVTGLSNQSSTTVESGLEALGPGLAKCVLTSLWDDAQIAIASKAAAKQASATVAPVAQIKAQVQIECVKRGWYPAGTISEPTTSSSGSTSGGSTSGGSTTGKSP